jgi:hypothetical protein
VTLTRPSSCARRRLAALGLVVWSLVSTAQADPRAAENIPALDPQSPPATTTELPAPYTSWQGSGFAPPKLTAARDVPPPLARPRERARRPFELSVAAATFLPSCGSGSIDDRACLTLSAGSGVEVAVLYRVTPFFAWGADAALSGFGNGHGMLASSGGGARFVGVTGRVYFADRGAWDPYVALTLGGGVLDLRRPEAGKIATSGLGARVAGGVDYAFGAHVRLGPSASFARWFAYADTSCGDGVCRDETALYGHVLGFATLGVRVSGSFGDAL